MPFEFNDSIPGEDCLLFIRLETIRTTIA
jgi:hypothetical protein